MLLGWKLKKNIEYAGLKLLHVIHNSWGSNAWGKKNDWADNDWGDKKNNKGRLWLTWGTIPTRHSIRLSYQGGNLGSLQKELVHASDNVCSHHVETARWVNPPSLSKLVARWEMSVVFRLDDGMRDCEGEKKRIICLGNAAMYLSQNL